MNPRSRGTANKPLFILGFAITALLAGLCRPDIARAQEKQSDQNIRFITDIEYAKIDSHTLKLDLYLPPTARQTSPTEQPPLIVWVHGGAWRRGSKAGMPLKWLIPHGFAIASIDYRLSPVARFPAQVHDAKAAIRFLRSQQAKYGYNTQRIAVAGSSAGGHLAALIGTTNQHAQLEGTVGGQLEQSSRVHAIVDYYGPTNFMTILPQSTPHGLSVRVPALQLLLGNQPEDTPELARLASPVFHVDDDDPPLLMLHGDQDPQVPINQSHELHAAYKQLGLAVQFEVVHGGAHGGALFFDDARRALVLQFLQQHLTSK